MSSVIELHDEENFNNDVLNSDVPVLVDFWAEWCGPCKQLSPTVEEIAEENKDKIKVCFVNERIMISNMLSVLLPLLDGFLTD